MHSRVRPELNYSYIDKVCMSSGQSQMVCTHLVDGIYQGFVNSSYQRHGFGIIQDSEFDHFIGFFKHNHPHGPALVIFRDGHLLYGSFLKGHLTGVTLTHTSQLMQLGMFSEIGMVGIGFEHNYETKVWKMNRYYKGVAIETLSEESQPEEAIPEMLSLEPTILRHYLNFRSRQFFDPTQAPGTMQATLQDINQFYVHPVGQDTTFFGPIIQGRREGVGLLFDHKAQAVLEAGFYREGVLDGYAFRADRVTDRQEEGLFILGKREGLFVEESESLTIFKNYCRQTGSFQNKQDASKRMLRKEQKIYNYRQNNFLSHNHSINFALLRTNFESGLNKAFRLQKEADQSKEGQIKTPRGKPSLSKGKPKNSPAFPSHLLASPGSEKASVLIMREKIALLTTKRREISQNSRQRRKVNLTVFENEEQNSKEVAARVEEDYEQSIEEEESPIFCEPNPTKTKPLFSTLRRNI